MSYSSPRCTTRKNCSEISAARPAQALRRSSPAAWGNTPGNGRCAKRATRWMSSGAICPALAYVTSPDSAAHVSSCRLYTWQSQLRPCNAPPAATTASRSAPAQSTVACARRALPAGYHLALRRQPRDPAADACSTETRARLQDHLRQWCFADRLFPSDRAGSRPPLRPRAGQRLLSRYAMAGAGRAADGMPALCRHRS